MLKMYILVTPYYIRYSDKESYCVTDICASTNVESLVDHRIISLLIHLEEVSETLSEVKKKIL